MYRKKNVLIDKVECNTLWKFVQIDADSKVICIVI